MPNKVVKNNSSNKALLDKLIKIAINSIYR